MKKLFLFFLLLFAVEAQAATFYVTTTGSDANSCAQAQSVGTAKATVQNAFDDCAGAGDEIQIRTGVYNEAPTFHNKAGTSWAAAITIKNYPAETPVFTVSGGNCVNRGWFWIRNAQFIQIDGITFSGLSCTLGSPFLVYGVDGASNIRLWNIDNNNVTNTGGNIYGTLIQSSTESTMNVHIKNYTCHNSNATGGTDHGECLYIQSGGTIIEDSNFENLGGAAVISFQNFRIPGGNIIRRNRLKNTGTNTGELGSCGISLSNITGVDVYNNIIDQHHSGDPPGQARCGGIRTMIGAENINIYNNTIYKSDSFCIYRSNLFGGSSNVNIINNICYQNSQVYTSDSEVVLDSGTTGTVSNNPTTDPTFVNAAAGDFALQVTSSAIDAGIALGSPFNTDFLGVTRSQGSAWDIGAYEYNLGGSTVIVKRKLSIMY